MKNNKERWTDMAKGMRDLTFYEIGLFAGTGKYWVLGVAAMTLILSMWALSKSDRSS